ncbi:lgals3bpa [Symbiodinium sp. CCMP2456]|nr:lgals3bpa [Symbiodinium sp. CCMP2456]
MVRPLQPRRHQQPRGKTYDSKQIWVESGHDTLQECANNCFWMNCKFFEFRREWRSCIWCFNHNAEGTDVSPGCSGIIGYRFSSQEGGQFGIPRLGTQDSRRRAWSAKAEGGIYRLNTDMQEYLKDRVKGGPNWKLLMSDGRRCKGQVFYTTSTINSWRMTGANVQQCADHCSSLRTNGPGGNCTYFGLLYEASWTHEVRCVTFNNNVGDVPETKPEGFDNCEPEVTNSVDDHRGRYWVVFELTRQDTPAGPRRTRRLQVVSTPEAVANAECEPKASEQSMYLALDPPERRPMMETIRTDVVRGPFGMEDVRYADPADMKAVDPEAPFKNAAEATGKHGFVEEIMGFFVAPFDGHYSFLTWGDVRQDIWLSTSTDPADTIKVAERIDSQPCRTGDTRRRNRYLGCSMFYNKRGHTSPWHGHIGTELKDSHGFAGNPTLGFRTPTEVTVPLKQGERRFFVKRTSLAESYRKNFDIRRRRRFRTYTGLRIHKPDLSSLTPSQQELLAQRKSWPEMVLLKRIISKDGGQWRIGLREARDDEPTYTNWIGWNFNDFHVVEALNAVVMPSGTQVHAEMWWMNNYNSGEESVTEYMITFLRPLGNLPELLIEYDIMRSRVEVQTIMHGNAEDLFIWPLSANLFEVPALEPSATLAATGIRAQYTTRVEPALRSLVAFGSRSLDPAGQNSESEGRLSDASAGNVSEDTDLADPEAPMPFPCTIGAFNDTMCGDSMGCQFEPTQSGVTNNDILDLYQLYDTWEECQQRCCQDQDSVSLVQTACVKRSSNRSCSHS